MADQSSNGSSQTKTPLDSTSKPLPTTPPSYRPFFSNRPSRVKPTFTTDSEPSPEEASLAAEIRDLFYKARNHRRPLIRKWYQHYQILNNGWYGVSKLAYMPDTDVPEIYPILTTVVAWITDRRPTIDIMPSYGMHQPEFKFFSQLASDLSTVMRSVWQNHFYAREIEKVVWDAHVYGTGIFKACWDASLDGGLGNAVIRRLDPWIFYPDPQAKSMEECNYFIEVKKMSVQEMDRRWPGSAKRTQNIGWTEDADKPPDQFTNLSEPPMGNPGAITGTTSSGSYNAPGSSNRIHANDEPGVVVLEAWLREHYAVDNVNDPEGPQVVIDQWRVVVIVGNTVLQDCPAKEVWNHGRHPYTRYVLHDTGDFWGPSMVEKLTPSQRSINELLSALINNILLSGNPILKEGTRAGTSRQPLSNKPGTRASVNEGGTYEWLQPPQIHYSSFQMIEWFVAEMERISGLQAIRGNVPTARNSEKVMDRTQEAGLVRVRMALRNLEWALQEQSSLVANMITENYTLPRFVAMAGKSGEKTMLALSGRHFYMPTSEGAVPMKFQLILNAGSDLPLSQDAMLERATMFYAMGVIDEEEVLKVANWPGTYDVLQRVRQMKAAGMMQPPGARQRAGRPT